MSYVCPHCNSFSSEDYICWVSTGHGDGNNRKKKALQLGVCGMWRPIRMESVQQDTGDTIVQFGVNANETKVFKAHAAPL